MKRYFLSILLIGIAFHLLGNFVKVELRERVYMQTDKHLYLAGEPILMKLLTTDAEQIPLVFSKVVYVELICDSVARLQIKVELVDGTGSGLMLLPVDLPTGYYRLIAYTQFMRNEGTDVFFEKNIAILNTFQSGYNPEEAENNLSSTSTVSTGEEVGTVSLQFDKSTYTTRERGELILNGLPENIHTLSVSIAGNEFISATESSVSLFQKNLTKKTSEFTDEFLPEYEGHIVTGKIIDNQTGREVNTNQPLVSGISFPTVEGIRFFSGQKTATGDILFFTSNISGMKEIATAAYSEDEKYRVDIQSPFVSRYIAKPMSALHIDTAYYGRLLERSVALQVFRYFSDDPSENRNVSAYLKMMPSMSYLLDDYTRFTTMREVFIEFIVGARFRRNAAGKQEISVYVKRGEYYNYGTMPLVFLDGVLVSDHDAIYNYDPLAVEQINVYYGPYILGGRIFDGIVELLTYRRLHQDLNLNKATQIIAYEGTQPPYRLNTPDYSEDENIQSRMPDARHTLLWNPDVCTDGKASVRLPFDTSDLTGEFQATVEGITKDGKFIQATVVFKVE